MICLALVVGLFATACGNSSDGEATPTPVEKVTLKVIVESAMFSEQSVGMYEKLKEMYEAKYPNVTIQYDLVPQAQLADKLKVEGSAGGGEHDVAISFSTTELAASGFLEDITPEISAWDGYASLPEGKKQRMSYASKIYGMTILNNSNGLWYNKDIFNQVNVDPTSIKTFDDLYAAYDKIVAANLKGADGNKVYPLSIQHDGNEWWFYSAFIFSTGAHLTDANRSKITINTPELVEGMTNVRNLFSKGYSLKPNSDYGINRGQFEKGNAATWVAGEWDKGAITKALGDKAGFMALPKGKVDASPLGGGEWVVPKGSKHKKEAIDFILLNVTPEAQTMMINDYDRLPTTMDMFESVAKLKEDAVLSVLGQIVKDKAVYLETKQFPDKPVITQMFSEIIDKVVFEDDTDIATLLAEYDAKAQDEFNK